jgi:ubiquinone/menaquinone biosynthesis C-methylase UbiE
MVDPAEDYRQSHLAKGEDYDSDLAMGNFDTYMTVCEHAILKEELPKLFGGKASCYLDFACGTGRQTQVIEKFADSSWGVDVSESMMEQAKLKCESTIFLHADITKDSIDIPPLDLITAFRFFGNAQDELRHAVLAGLRKLIKPGGYLVINNHRNPCSLHGLMMRVKGDHPGTDLSYWKLKRLYAAYGFELRKVVGIGIWVAMHRLRFNTMERTVLMNLEPLSRLPYVGRFCPDSIVIAQAV